MSEMPGDLNIDLGGIDSAIERSMRGLDAAMRDLNHGLRGGYMCIEATLREANEWTSASELARIRQLVVESHEGRIEVAAHDASEIVIDAYRDSSEEKLPIHVTHEGNEVCIAARPGHAQNDVDLRVRVPLGVEVRPNCDRETATFI